MNGAAVIGALLRESEQVTAAVPLAQIKAGALPENCALPALLIRTVSVVDRHRLKQAAVTRSTERVSVTVRAASYRDQSQIIRLVRKVCAGFVGDKGDALRAAVLTAGLGPDVLGPGGSFEQSQDFRVSFDAIT